jgi:hypothetical protein
MIRFSFRWRVACRASDPPARIFARNYTAFSLYRLTSTQRYRTRSAMEQLPVAATLRRHLSFRPPMPTLAYPTSQISLVFLCPRLTKYPMSYTFCSVVQSDMRSAIQTRLDSPSRKRLAVLVRELGWTPSQIVREGLRVLAASYLRRKKRGVIGLGKFSSGVRDLASNKKHLRDFGR